MQKTNAETACVNKPLVPTEHAQTEDVQFDNYLNKRGFIWLQKVSER